MPLDATIPPPHAPVQWLVTTEEAWQLQTRRRWLHRRHGPSEQRVVAQRRDRVVWTRRAAYGV